MTYQNPTWDDLSPRIREIAEPARRAVLDGRDVILIGLPGAGKTMIARRLRRDIRAVDRMGTDAAMVHRLAGLDCNKPALWQPFRAPHHTVSVAGLVGGGSPVRPGEVHLAHGGVLFLDDAPEFSRPALQAVAIAHREKVTTFNERQSPWLRALPCDFVLVVACNPCPGPLDFGKVALADVPKRYAQRLEALKIRDAVIVEIPPATTREA